MSLIISVHQQDIIIFVYSNKVRSWCVSGQMILDHNPVSIENCFLNMETHVCSVRFSFTRSVVKGRLIEKVCDSLQCLHVSDIFPK